LAVQHEGRALRQDLAMTALGELLELIHDAADHAGPTRLTALEWNDLPRMHEAFGRSGIGGTAYAGPPRGPETSSSTTRLLWQSADVQREESAGVQEGRRVLVRNGPHWTVWDADWGASAGSDDEGESGPHPQLAFLVDPAVLLGALRLEPRERTAVAGREAIAVHALPRRGDSPGAPILLHRLGMGAEWFDLAVDAERGTLLYVEASIAAGPFHRFEVIEIAFRKDFPKGTFDFEPPSGEDVQQGLWARPEPVPLDLAAREAPFTVLVPTRVPAGWRLGTLLVRGRDRPHVEASVHLAYTSPEGAYSVQLRERASGAAADDDWLSYERQGRLEVADAGANVDPRWYVRLEDRGTLVELFGSVPLELLTGLAETLVPARAEPPRLGDG
jgi:hypothetical protein